MEIMNISRCLWRSRKLGDISRLPISLKITLREYLAAPGRARLPDKEHGRRRSRVGLPKKRTSTPGGGISDPPLHPAPCLGLPLAVAGDCRPRGDARWHCAPRWLSPRRSTRSMPVDLVIDPLGHGRFLQLATTRCSRTFLPDVRSNSCGMTSAYAFLRWGQHAFDNFRVGGSARL